MCDQSLKFLFPHALGERGSGHLVSYEHMVTLPASG